MKTKLIILISLIGLLFGCIKTDIRNKGSITVTGEGPIYNLSLEVPPDLEDSVHKAMWICEPEDAGIISYKENTIFGKEALAFKEDRTARLTLLDVVEVTVNVYMVHNSQSSPHLFASTTIDGRVVSLDSEKSGLEF